MNELAQLLRTVGQWLGHPLFSLGETTVSAFSLLSALLIFVAFLVLSRIVGRAIDRFTRERPSFHPASVYALKQMLHYSLFALGILLALSSIGIDFSKLAIVAGAVGVGVGLGLPGVAQGLLDVLERRVHGLLGGILRQIGFFRHLGDQLCFVHGFILSLGPMVRAPVLNPWARLGYAPIHKQVVYDSRKKPGKSTFLGESVHNPRSQDCGVSAAASQDGDQNQ